MNINNNIFSNLLSPQKYFIELHRNVLTYVRFSEVVFLPFLDQDVAIIVNRALLKISV